MELILVLPLATFLWWAVAHMAGQLAARDLMDDLRPTQAEIAAIEATLPDMRKTRR